MRYRGYRRKMNDKHKTRLRRMADMPTKFPAGAVRVSISHETGEKDLAHTDDETTYVRRTYATKKAGIRNRYGFYKKHSNRKARRYLLEGWGTAKNFYRRIFDYWWTVD